MNRVRGVTFKRLLKTFALAGKCSDYSDIDSSMLILPQHNFVTVYLGFAGGTENWRRIFDEIGEILVS